MTIPEARQIHDLLVQEKWTEAANLSLSLAGQKPVVKTKAQALDACRGLIQFLLDDEQYLVAATILWGGEVFNAEPECVRRVFHAMHTNAKVLFQGASSMGKSYSCGAWMYLDWRRDPWYTGVKCVGVSDDQVRKNVFAHILKLHRAASVPMLEEITVRDSDMWMGIKEAGFEFGITAVAYKQSQETSGAIKGYKSMPVRKKPHPKFGVMSRLRLLGDEGQNWPNGPFQDLNTWISQIEGTEIVKIAIAFNPEFTSKLVVQMAEPDHGWDIDDVDRLYDWDSKFGWRVCRLDAAKCENVIKREKVYHGLQTYDGFMSYLKAGGDASASYFTFARGFPPLKGSVNTIIPPAWPQEQRGEAVFIDTPKTIAAVDLAFMGQDSAQMAVGRWGLASGWHDSKGKYTKFMDRLNISSPKPRHVLQIDQILPLEKHDDTSKMAEEIIGRCKMLGIPPERLGVDKTGIGLGTYSHLARVWGDVIGIGWGDGATDLKILAEDKEPASMQCEGISSEMWWTFRRWLDPRCCAILINPIIPTQPIQTQLTSRRYRTGKRGIKVESKEEYKARNQKSPDEVDACIMLPLVVRRISDVIPGLSEETKPMREEAPQMADAVILKPIPSYEDDDAIGDSGED